PERREKKEDSNLPRLDPEGVSILEVGDRVVAAIGLERPAPGEPTGSVLFVDVTGALDGRAPTRIARRLAGANEGASPEGIVAISKRGLVVVACEGDGGSLSWFGVGETLAEPRTARAEANRSERSKALGAPSILGALRSTLKPTELALSGLVPGRELLFL